MTIDLAKKVKIGDKVSSKDGFLFTIEEIREKSDAANINHYLEFVGTTDGGLRVFYIHKNLKNRIW
jgi:hypothetical protein